MGSSFVKDPDANLPYGVDWSSWLADGDTIGTSTWIVPVGLTAGVDSVDGGMATVWLSGGALGEDYTVVNRVTTSSGMADDRSIRILVRER